MYSGKVIKSCRTARGLSMRELSRRSGISAAQISCLERGKYEPHFITFRRLMEAMDYSLVLKDKKRPFRSEGIGDRK